MIFTLVESLEVEFFDGINLNSFNRVRFFQSGDKHQNIIFSTGLALPSGPAPSPGKYFGQIFFFKSMRKHVQNDASTKQNRADIHKKHHK